MAFYSGLPLNRYINEDPFSKDNIFVSCSSKIASAYAHSNFYDNNLGILLKFRSNLAIDPLNPDKIPECDYRIYDKLFVSDPEVAKDNLEKIIFLNIFDSGSDCYSYDDVIYGLKNYVELNKVSKERFERSLKKTEKELIQNVYFSDFDYDYANLIMSSYDAIKIKNIT